MPSNHSILAAVLFVVLVMMVVSQSIGDAQANPYIRERKSEGTIPAPTGTEPPTITVVTPVNQSDNYVNNVYLNFTAAIENSNSTSFTVTEVSYRGSWQKMKTEIDPLTIFARNLQRGIREWPSNFSANITDIPPGPHWIEITVTVTTAAYDTRTEIDGIFYTQYFINYAISSTSTVYFTTGDIPRIQSVSVENRTFISQDVPLTVMFEKKVKEAYYNLDNRGNVSFSGNTTLIGLENGWHNVTVYSTNDGGFAGVPKTVCFNVEVPLSFWPVVAVFILIISVIVTVVWFFRFYLSNEAKERSKD